MSQTIWTVLPNGGNAQTLAVSLLVSLRLDDGTVAGSLPGNFAQTILGLPSMTLVFDDAAETEVTVTLDKSLLTPELWDLVFPGGTPVEARVLKNLASRPMITFPVKRIRDSVEELFKDTAENYGLRPPPLDMRGEPTSKIREFIDVFGEEAAQYDEPRPPGGPVVAFTAPTLPTDPGRPTVAELRNTSEFYQASRFYRRKLNRNAPLPALAPVEPPSFDFHKALALLGDHPHLLRRLGLIVDGTIPRAQVPAGATRVKVKNPPGAGNRTPFTRFTLDASAFSATPTPDSPAFPVGPSDVTRGFLQLGDPAKFVVHQFDVDSAALKLGDFALNQFRFAELDTAEPGPFRGAELPTLRTAGIVVARDGRGDRMTARLQRGFDLDTMGDDDGFFVDDLLRGYRVDIRRESESTWYSLSRRRGAFLLGPARQRVPASGDVSDEGYVKATAATSDDIVSDTKALYAHEVLFGWDGWSHVAPQPGRSIVFDETNTDAAGQPRPEKVDRVENLAASDFPVEPRFKVEPGTLPKLRFGETYRLRARAVDLAGNSVPLSTPLTDATLQSPPVVYRRQEPVPQPVLVLRRPVVEGESLEHIVIRTQAGNPQGAGGVFFSSNDRHVAVPSASFDMALQHGMVDSSFWSPALSYNLGLKSEGTFLDASIWDTLLGIKTPVLGIEVINSPEVPPGTPAVLPAARGDGLVTGQYLIHRGAILRLPYLPDPLAKGFALADARDSAHQTSAVGLHDYTYFGGWPDVVPAKINVRSTTQAEPRVVNELDGLTVYLPPGTILPLLVSSTLKNDALGKMGIWSLMAADKQAAQRDLALRGQHWMLTPRRTVVAVNAVERPIRAAQFTGIAVLPMRAPGETFVRLGATVDVHARSTGQIDIEAAWTDRVDRVAEPGPSDEAHAGHVFTYRPGYHETTAVIPAVGSTEDRERPKHDFGDTKHRFVRYRPDATTRYREYFPPSLTANRANIVFPGVETTVNVPSSARPRAPEVLYVVPTFKWDTTVNNGLLSPTNTTSKRIGRGLRVYLDRPWYSSGEGEQLAVILQGTTGATDASRKYITEWGSDPTWHTVAQGPTTAIAPSNFTNASAVTGNALTIDEDPSIRVQAVAFNVQYNAERKVWYADIEMGDVAGYFPFVRLGLARYQKDSVGGLELSPIVKAEFAQLVNDRSATLQFQASLLSRSIRVSVRGIAARNRLGQKVTALPPGSAPTPPSGYTFNRNAGAGRVVTAQIENLELNRSDVEWQSGGSAVLLPSYVANVSPGNEVLWSGSVPVPLKPLTVVRRRLVIREIELFETDPGTSETVPVPLPGGVTARGRVVYLDTIPFDDLDFI